MTIIFLPEISSITSDRRVKHDVEILRVLEPLSCCEEH